VTKDELEAALRAAADDINAEMKKYCHHTCGRCGGGVSHYELLTECNEPATLPDYDPAETGGIMHPDCNAMLSAKKRCYTCSRCGRPCSGPNHSKPGSWDEDEDARCGYDINGEFVPERRHDATR
jgi:hypothetical protein